MIEIASLSPADIAKWFRHQAKTFNQMADTVETTFKASPTAKQDREQPALPTLGTVTPEAVRKAVSKNALRVATLAKMFSVEAHVIEGIVKNPDNGLVVGNKGWIKPKE